MNEKLGDVGTKTLFENDQVKTWDLVLHPGQSSDWHRHSMHYVFVVTRAGRLLAEYEDGTSAQRDYALGEVVMGQKDSLHRVTNTGPEIYSNAIVEIKPQ